jgi:glycyl-tRNA synthetase
LATAPAVADETLASLQQLVGSGDFADLVAVLQRVRRIVPEGTEASYDPAKLTEPAEVVLHEAVQKVGQAPTGLADFATAASVLVEPVSTFFDEILVMAEDPEIRAARLGLLATISRLAAPVLDWQALGTSLTPGE